MASPSVANIGGKASSFAIERTAAALVGLGSPTSYWTQPYPFGTLATPPATVLSMVRLIFQLS
ncbi:MAG: hypothetical protein IJR26_01060 [Bacteroidales bacterium]|nr:hypothetical protein [Bacteroidales bacterium]